MTEQPHRRYFAQELAPDHNSEVREQVRLAPDADETKEWRLSLGRADMHRYNPMSRSVEDVPAPSTDEEAIEMLSGAPDSGALVENYVELRGEGMGIASRRCDLRRPPPADAALEVPTP